MAKVRVLWQQSASARKGGWRKTKVSVEKQALTAHLDDILRRIGQVARVEIELTLVGDSEITKLKQQFFGRSEPTDVLSFENPSQGFPPSSVEGPNPSTDLLGSIVISVDTAARQAEAAGIALEDELKMLAGHGLLHLLGYGHR